MEEELATALRALLSVLPRDAHAPGVRTEEVINRVLNNMQQGPSLWMCPKERHLFNVLLHAKSKLEKYDDLHRSRP